MSRKTWCFLALTMTLTATAAFALAPMPPLVSRTDWGARDPQCSITYCSPWQHVTIHHSAASTDYNAVTLDDCKARVRAHQNYHMDTNGWCDIGYNFLVCKHGDIFEGREDSLIYARGAHDSINCNGLGICALGYFHTPYNDQPTPEMIGSIEAFIAWQWDALGRSPYGTGTYGGNTENIIGGHRDVSATACPGDIMYSMYVGADPNSGVIRDGVCAIMDTCGAPPQSTPVHVNSITMSWVKTGNKYKARAVVNVKSDTGANVSGATVTGDFTGAISNLGKTGVTDSSGNATITATTGIKTGTVTFTVTNITGTNMTYDSGANVVTSASISR